MSDEFTPILAGRAHTRHAAALEVEPGQTPRRGRFLFAQVAAARAYQLRRGARPRVQLSGLSPGPERLAIEEVRRGLVSFQVTPAAPVSLEAPPPGQWEVFTPADDFFFTSPARPLAFSMTSLGERDSMAQVIVKPEYEVFAAELLRVCADRGVRLSEGSAGLLRLAAEAWFDEPIALRNGVFRTPAQRRALAEEILTEALNDPHVVPPAARRHVPAEQPVTFHSMLVALSDAGKRLLAPFIEKGI